jgi:hypothetical protein
MDHLNLTHIAITNLLSTAVGLHDSIAGKLDTLVATRSDISSPLPNIGVEFTQLQDTYRQIRELSITLEHLAGYDMFTLCNDFKTTKPTIVKILRTQGVL